MSNSVIPALPLESIAAYAQEIITAWSAIQEAPESPEEEKRVANRFSSSVYLPFLSGNGEAIIGALESSDQISPEDRLPLLVDITTALMEPHHNVNDNSVGLIALVGIPMGGGASEIKTLCDRGSEEVAMALLPWMGEPDVLHISPMGVLSADDALALASSPLAVWELLKGWAQGSSMTSEDLEAYRTSSEKLPQAASGYVLVMGVKAHVADLNDAPLLVSFIDSMDDVPEKSAAELFEKWEEDIHSAGFCDVPLGSPDWLAQAAIEAHAIQVELRSFVSWAASSPGEDLPSADRFEIIPNKNPALGFDVQAYFLDGSSLVLQKEFPTKMESFFPYLAASFTCKATVDLGRGDPVLKFGEWPEESAPPQALSTIVSITRKLH